MKEKTTVSVQEVIKHLNSTTDSSLAGKIIDLLEDKFQTTIDQIITLECIETCLLSDDEYEQYKKITTV